MTFSSDDIFQLAETIWSVTLGLPIAIDTSSTIVSRPHSTIAYIQITGAWNGTILLDSPAEVSQRAASGMFSVELERLNPSDIRDAIAELVNMIGGHVKALLPEPCYLSLPTVVDGNDCSAHVSEGRLVSRVDFLCEGYPFSILIFEMVAGRGVVA